MFEHFWTQCNKNNDCARTHKNVISGPKELIDWSDDQATYGPVRHRSISNTEPGPGD